MVTKQTGQGFTPYAPHHYYWGLLLMAAGFVLVFKVPDWLLVLPLEVAGLGLWIAVDDWVQHWKQRKNPGYHTPWHNVYWGALNAAITRLEGHPNWAWLRRVLEWLKTV